MVDYPFAGSNPLSAGGGGQCKYNYDAPVVTSATCTITPDDINKGTGTNQADRDYVHRLGGHDGCDHDDAGHILAHQLGGKAVPTNLFPQVPHLNRFRRFRRRLRVQLVQQHKGDL